MRSGVAALLLIATLAPVTIGNTSTWTFASVTIDTQQRGEPGFALDKATTPWTTYVTVPACGTALWRSIDGGRSFSSRVCTNSGGGDADVSVDADSIVFVTDLQDGPSTTRIPVFVSMDHGRTYAYSRNLDPTNNQNWDREWIVASGHGNATEIASQPSVAAFAWRTTDTGRTWTGPMRATPNPAITGKPLVTPSGNIVFPYCEQGTAARNVTLASSSDGGATWSQHVVTQSRACRQVPSLAQDDTGNLFMVWNDVLGTGYYVVYYAASADGGVTWSAPRLVSSPTQNALFPAVTAGASDKVDIVYYRQNWNAPESGILAHNVPPDASPPTSTWDVMLAQSVDALDESPVLATTLAYATTHTGSICTFTGQCVLYSAEPNAPLPLDRRMLDFFDVTTDEQGNALIAHPVDRPATTGNTNDAVQTVDLVLTRQTAGPTIR